MTTMKYLSELKDKKTKAITLSVEQSDINDTILDDLFHAVSEHSGNCQLKFELHDFKTKTKLKMPSRTMKVAIEKEFIKNLIN